MHRTWLAVVITLATGATGCIGAPSPLAPGVRGSIGVPHRGSLTGGESLAYKGDGYELYRKYEVRWGNPRLVQALKHAAAHVSKTRPGGAPVLFGDLSHKHGGAASGHRSHRNGRDADIILYALTPDGRPVRAPGFVDYGPDGLAVHQGKFYRLDIERTWLFVKDLITSPTAGVQWLFLAAWLEALLVEHARARGETDDVVHRAESVLLQPGDSTPHADHLHLRIACTPDELVAGCAGGGPRWRWLSPMPQLPPQSDRELIASIIGDLLPPGALTNSTAADGGANTSSSAPGTATSPPSTQGTAPSNSAPVPDAEGTVE
ncbi:MAG: penicillin-insensitive murein endopeptidase [Polyangiaceae bacterium]|nr:penicillin-insensitive murein endopeptidase [Polyangiaceae bacterium]